MSYQGYPPNPQHPGAPAQGGGAPAQHAHAQAQHAQAQAQHAQAQARRPADDGLDAIPMQKTKPGLIIAIIVGALLVLGVTGWAMFGGKKSSKAADEAAAAQGEGESGMTLKEQREHLATTQRALEKFEAAEKDRKAAEGAKKAVEEEKKKKEEAAKKAGAGGPAPVTGAAAKKAGSDLDSLGSDYASQLGK